MLGHSIFYDYAPSAILDIIKKETPHERLRRNIWNLQISGENKQSLTKYIIPKEWNDLNSETKKIKDKQKFKKEIQKDILNNYNDTIRCNDQNCRICN